MEQEGQILTAMDAVMHAHVRAGVYQHLYLGLEKRRDVADALEDGIIKQFAAICAFLGLAVDYYSSGSVENTVNGLLNPSALAKCIEKITETELQVERHARVCAAVLDEETRQQHGERLKTLDSVLAGLMDSFGKLQVGSTTIEAGVDQLLEALTANQTHEIMRWISQVPYESDLYNSERGRLTGTCGWLIAHNTYRQWKRSPRSMILWLHGIRRFSGSDCNIPFVVADSFAVIAGAGKTKLSTKVVDDMALEDVRLAYFFCDRNQEDRSDPLGVLLSITKQLSWVTGQKYVRQCTVEAYNRKKNDNFASNMFTPEECQDILFQLTAEIRQSVIVVDGLDECNERTRGDVLKTLDHLVRHSTKVVKVFVASRNDKDLTQHFINSPNLEIEAAHNQDDIEKLVVDRISHNKWAAKNMTDEVRQKVVELFREKSQGMYVTFFSEASSDRVLLTLAATRFQWAALHIDDLLEIESNEDTLKWLTGLPRGLEAAYDRIYHSIEERGDRWLTYANRTFMWLMSSSTPIQLETLCILACQDSGEDFNPEAKLSRDSLLAFCRNCVKVDLIDRIECCRFAHLSVQEYLERRRLNNSEARRMAWGVFRKYGQWSASSPSSTHARGRTDSAIRYMASLSISNFITSADMCEMEEDSWDILLRSTDGQDVIFGSPIWHAFDDYKTPPQSSVAIGRRIIPQNRARATQNSLGSFTQSAVDEMGLLEQKSDLKGPIGTCVRHNITSPVGYWLNHQMFNPETACVTAQALLMVAWKKQHFAICDMLLDAGAAFQGESSDRLGLFVRAVFYYRREDSPHGTFLRLLRRLIEGGASAARLGRLNEVVFTNPDTFEIAQLCLENGASPNPLDGEDVNPPLNCAVRLGDANIATTKLLLRCGAEVNKCHGFWESAMQRATNASHTSVETLKLLLEHGADPNIWSGGSYSPLQYAVIWHNDEAVRLLLAKGTDVDAVSDGKGTALHIAASEGSEGQEFYELLLENGADTGKQCFVHEIWNLERPGPRDEIQYTAEQVYQVILKKERQLLPGSS